MTGPRSHETQTDRFFFLVGLALVGVAAPLLRPNEPALGQEHNADLTKVDLTNADLSGANLFEANLANADLSKADLTNADLSGADLTGADFTGADLTGVELMGLRHEGATAWPDRVMAFDALTDDAPEARWSGPAPRRDRGSNREPKLNPRQP